MKYIFKLTALLLLLLGWSFTANAQPDPPLNLLPELEPITAANASRLQPVAELGVDLIHDVAWSPDGKMLAIAGSAGLWRYDVDQPDARPILIEGYSGLFRSVVFSPDGKLIATGNDVGLIQLWDAQTWTKVSVLQESTGHSIERLAFSPDSKLLAVPFDSKTVQIWDVAKKTIARTWNQSEQIEVGITDVVFSPDGSQLLIVSNGRANLLEVSSGKSTRFGAADQPYPASRAAFSPDGHFIITVIPQMIGDGAGPVVPLLVWDAQTGDFLAGIEGGQGNFNSVAFGADNRVIVNDLNDKTLVWRVEDLLTAWKNDPHEEWFGSYTDGEAFIQQTLPGGDFTVLNPQRTMLAVINNSSIQLVQVQDGTQKAAFQLPGFNSMENHRVNVIAFSPTDPLVAFGSGSDIRLMNTETGLPAGVLSGHERPVIALLFSRDGKRLFSGSGGSESEWGDNAMDSEDGAVRVWNVETRTPLTVLHGFTTPITHLQLSADDTILASALTYGGVMRNFQLWDWADGKQLNPIEGDIGAVTFSPKDPLAVIVTDDYAGQKSHAVWWDIENHKTTPLAEGKYEAIGAAIFSPDGDRMLINVNNMFQFWDVQSQTLLTTRPATLPPAFSPDGKYLTYTDETGVVIENIQSGATLHIDAANNSDSIPSFNSDGSLIYYNESLWNAQTGELLTTINSGTGMYAPYGDVYTIDAISPDGKFLAATQGGGVRLWGVPAR